MRVFFDENMPRPLRKVLDGHEVSSVEQEGWKGKRNGELLSLVEQRFDVILTSDGSIGYQNTLLGRDLSMVIVPTNNLTQLLANAVALRVTLDDIAQLDYRVVVTIGWKGRRSLKRLDVVHGDIELSAVPSFQR